ncbi:MAG TPA: intradiol ring-cleavage dioxygenase [Rhodocyclaceae bacterium]
MTRTPNIATIVVLVAFVAATAFAQTPPLQPTPRDMRGPYYPDSLPADRDADLTQIAGHAGTAQGQVLLLDGRVLDRQGKPMAGVQVEIWQTDANGRYIHSGDRGKGKRDPGFQGFGATVTAADGRYAFRTVVPKSYGSRPPHVHARLLRDQREVLVTQIYFPQATGEPGVSPDWARQRDLNQTLHINSAAGATDIRAAFDFVLAD